MDDRIHAAAVRAPDGAEFQAIEFQGAAADSWRASLILQAEELTDDHEAAPDDDA